ncbi:MAG TPA: ATP-binding cassette domain-containing protein, partial [Candidatus Binatia bacterium]|nr:ATP-binding cassette domain-containing protein [Candidatus Binatia bacterium]
MNWATVYAGQRDMELETDAGWSTAERNLEARRGESVAIRLEAVEKSFGDRRVLRGLSVTIAPGQFVAVVGRSGCGKTTLLR